MFQSEAIREVFNSIRQNKIRTILAGFGVAWGIFILVILLGVGQGFQNGVMSMFDIFAQKSMYVYGNRTSLKYRNMKEGMEVLFDKEYLHALHKRYAAINAISPEIMQPNMGIIYKEKNTFATITGVESDYFHIKLLQPKSGGRLFNAFDIRQGRDVVIIGEGIEQTLFGKKSSLGCNVNIGGTIFKIVGVLKSDNLFSIQERNSVYIPFGSFTRNITKNAHFNSFCMMLNSRTDTRKFETELKYYIAYKSGFDIEDTQAVFIANIEAQTSSFESLFNGLKILIWGIGICFLLSGIVGICNIMLIIVKERTNEIGIRKAVGALPTTIINLVLSEAVTITMLAGVIGIILGTGVLYLIDLAVQSLADTSVMAQTSIDIPIILFAVLVLVLSGIIAGLFPAIKAAQIMPVDAIRYENRG